MAVLPHLVQWEQEWVFNQQKIINANLCSCVIQYEQEFLWCCQAEKIIFFFDNKAAFSWSNP